MKIKLFLMTLVWVNLTNAQLTILDEEPSDLGPKIGFIEHLRPVLQRRKASGEGAVGTLYARYSGDDSDTWFSLSSVKSDLKKIRSLFEHQADYDYLVTWHLQRGNTDQVRLTE